MSPAEKRAKRRLLTALGKCAGEDFIVDGLSVDRPREIKAWAHETRKGWERKTGREGSMARVVLAELAAAAQGYADVHERAERERATAGLRRAQRQAAAYEETGAAVPEELVTEVEEWRAAL